MTSAQTSTKPASKYENNPFFVAVNGLELLFKKAQAIGIIFAVIAVLSAFSSLPTAFIPADEPAMTPQQSAQADKEFADGIASVPVGVWVLIAAVIVTVLLVAIAFGTVVGGVTDYTAAQLSHNKDVGFSEALRAVFSNFWGYLWVNFIVTIKVFLWTLLFIIPGVIMSIRYSLAGVAYFDKKLKGNAAVKESARLTKDGWLTTFASNSLFNLITFSLIAPLLVPGTRAVLYQQFRDYDAAGLAKPKAHVLSWLTLIIPIVLVVITILLVIAIVALIATQ